MNKKGKKLISIFLSIIIAASALSQGMLAFAEDDTEKLPDFNERYESVLELFENNKADDPYMDLSEALKNEYVADVQNYTAGTNKITVVDNEFGAIYTAAEAFWKIALATYSTDSSSSANNNTNVKVADTIKNKLKEIMGEQYNTYNVDTVLTYFIGGNTSVKSATTYEFNVVSAQDYAYLLKYASVDEIPESIVTSSSYFWRHSSKGIFIKTYYLNSIERIENSVDTQSKKNFTNFNTLFSDEVLSTAPSDLNEVLLSNINENGFAAIEAIKQYSTVVLEHILGSQNIVSTAENYLDRVKTQILKEYIDCINSINALYGNKTAEELSRDEVNNLNDNLQIANTIYEAFNNEQKNDERIVAANTLYNSLYTLYIEARNIYLNNDYKDNLSLIANEFNINIINTISSYNSNDDMNETVVSFVKTYVSVVNVLQTIDVAQYNTLEKINARLISDLKVLLGDNYNSYNIETVLSKISAVGSSDNSFSVTEDKLSYLFNSITDIPESFEANKTTFNYIYENNNLVEIKIEVSSVTDNLSYIVFNNYKQFYDRVNSVEVDIDTLCEIYQSAKVVESAVSHYSEMQLDNLISTEKLAQNREMFARISEKARSLYNEIASELSEKYGSKKLLREDMIKIAELLSDSDKLYSTFIDSDLQNSDIITSKQKTEKIRTKFNDAVVEFKWEDYDANVDKFATLIKSEKILSINSNSVRDNIANDVLNIAQLYFDIANLLHSIDPDVYKNTSSISNKLIDDLKSKMGDSFISEMETVINKFISGGTGESAVFSVIPEYLSQYTAISQIPEIINYDKIVFEYNHSSGNGVFSKIEKKTEAMTDVEAYNNFNSYKNYFTDKFLNADLVKLYTFDQLIDMQEQVLIQLGKVSGYSDEIKQVLLSYNYALANSMILKVDNAIAVKYVSAVNDFVARYNKIFTTADRENFKAESMQIAEMLSKLSDVVKNNENVLKANEQYYELIAKMDIFIEIDDYNLFLNACKPLSQFYTQTGETIIYKDLSLFDITSLKSVLNGASNRYFVLTDSVKNYSDVINFKTIIDELSNRLNTIVGQKEWNQTNVTYPDSVTSKDVDKFILTLDKIIESDLIKDLLGGSLNDVVMDAIDGLWTNELVNTVLSALYPIVYQYVADFSSILPLVGLYVRPADLAGRFDASRYPQAKAALAAAGNNWENVIWENVYWGEINNRDDFFDALGEGFKGIAPMLRALLTGDKIGIIGITIISGNKGYDKDILPLLEALGCEDALTTAEFESIKSSPAEMLKGIAYPLLNRVDKLLKSDTVEQILDLIPNLSYIMLYDLLVDGVADLGSPLAGFGLDLVAILNDAGLDLSDPIGLINGLISSLGIQLPSINWAKSAGLGEWIEVESGRTGGKRNTIVANTADVGFTVLTYIAEVLKFNQDTILELVAGLGDFIGDGLLKPLLKNSNENIAAAIVRMVNSIDESVPDFNWNNFVMNWVQSSFTYPNGVTAEQTTQVISKIDSLISKLVKQFSGKTLNELIGDALYSPNLVAELTTTIYKALEDETIKTVLNVLGIDITPKAVANLIGSDYGADVSVIAKYNSWNDVKPGDLHFNVSDRDSFVKSLSLIFRPFYDLLGVVLNSGELAISNALTFKGANGYSNTVEPLLNALGCASVLSAQSYENQANKNTDNLLINILNPLLSLVEEIAKSPVKGISGILPNLARFFNNNGLSVAIENLLLPVTKVIDPALELITDKKALPFVMQLLGVDKQFDITRIETSLIPLVNSLLGNINIDNASISLSIPDINWGTLAGYGTIKGDKVIADNNKVFISVLRYVHRTLVVNKTAVNSLLTQLVGSNDLINQVVNNLANMSSDRFIKTIFDLLTKLGGGYDFLWAFRSISSIETNFTQNYGREEYTYALENIDALILEMLGEFMGGSSLKDMLSGALYTNSTVNSLVETIYKALGTLDIGIDINEILSIVGIDISPKGFAGMLKESKFASVKKALEKSNNWNNVSLKNASWGFKDGDRDGFAQALAASLRPIQPLIKLLLANGNITVVDELTIYGANGYNNAIIPLLEMLGCNKKDITPVSTYLNNSDSDDVLLSIINPLLKRVEQLLDKPFETLCEILPNLAYFFYNGSIGTIVNNLIQPVTSILNQISPIYPINIDLSAINNFELISTVNSLLSSIKIGGSKLGVQLLDINYRNLSGRGDIVKTTSLRTYNGKNQTITTINADKTAVFITALRYVIDNLKAEQNIDAVIDLLSGLELDESISEIVGTVLEMLTTQDTDEIIETLYDLLFGTGVAPEDMTVETDSNNKWTLKQYNTLLFWFVTLAIVAGIVVGITFLVKYKKKKKLAGKVNVEMKSNEEE